MQILVYISNWIVPFIVLSIVIYGLLANINVYETFIRGAKSGFLTVIRIMPTLIGLMAAVGILRASGFLDFLSEVIGRFSSYIGFPGELVPLTVVKMFSSSAATGLLLDIYKEFGTDSRLGLIASISLCCTETIFYTMSVYFMTAGIKHSRYTLAGALLSTFAGLAASVVLAGMMRV
ncbi:MAG TPA: spore maturation protein [Candidatus Mediterraneibacter pullicola]|uniref:Spore maturation protein n=1 Tax=Candidatus Mediterraneibacter pullicola TaxID=2838682 RepID=A0A9D2KJL9_9FIRM|nr:spore maturation protein [Candidatus Mediterraneibacter pullicola]